MLSGQLGKSQLGNFQLGSEIQVKPSGPVNLQAWVVYGANVLGSEINLSARSQIAVEIDSVTFSDSAIVSQQIQVIVLDIVAFYDNYDPPATPLGVFDALSFSDSIMAAIGFAFTDLIDLFDQEISTLIAFDDEVDFFDSIELFIPAVINVTDTLSFSDSISHSSGAFAILTDTLVVSDSSSISIPTIRSPQVLDFLSILDMVALLEEIFLVVSDLLVVTDNLALGQGLVFPEDSLSFSDAVSDALGNGNVTDTFSDTVSVMDSITIVVTIVPNQTDLLFIDSLSFTDSVQITQVGQLNPYIRQYLNDVVMQ